MKRAEHEAESLKLFGKPHTEVHAWLDGLSWKDGKFDPFHRRHRHHMVGANTIGHMYGKAARQAAIRHIISDLSGAGWTATDGIPQNTLEYDKLFDRIHIFNWIENKR